MHYVAIIWVLLLILPCGVAASNASKRFNQGLKAFAAQNYEAALEAFQQAADENPVSPEILYNLGNTYYRLNRYSDAQNAFEMASNLNHSPALQQQLFYNLGDTLVKMAKLSRESDPYAAQDACRQAAIYFSAALQMNPAFTNAAYNLEICRRIAQQIALEIKQKEKQDQQKQQNDDSDQNADDSDDDMDYEETDQDADMYEEADPFGDFSEYEEVRGLPPPNTTEIDIIKEELRNQEQRKEKRAGSYKPVDKDW